MLTIGLANIHDSDLTNMFTSTLVNIFTSDWGNIFGYLTNMFTSG